MNELEAESLYLREIYINVNKLFIFISVFCLHSPFSVVVACLLAYPLFILMFLLPVYFFIPFFVLMLLLYFCLFVDHVNKSNVVVFRALVYLLTTLFPFWYVHLAVFSQMIWISE